MTNHWDNQALTVKDDAAVNIGDIYQRELEFEFITKYLKPYMNVLEVGCGNGYSTSRFREMVSHIDAFDLSPAMIGRAKATYGETNNTFRVADILEHQWPPVVYDIVICVRVLINLKSLDDQKLAIKNLKAFVAPKGQLILVEGFSNGFKALDHERVAKGLPELTPSPFNFYSSLQEILPCFEGWHMVESFHTGLYDWLTRVVYPLYVGSENVDRNSPFSAAAMKAARGQMVMREYARVWGWVMRRAG